MFFSLARVRDPRFPCHTQLGPWTLNHDHGWQQHDDCVVKTLGACNDDLGFWTQFQNTNHGVELRHARLRGYPLWWDRDRAVLTNLAGTGERIWTDDRVTIGEHDITCTKVDVIGALDIATISSHHAVARISDILVGRVEHLFRQTPHLTKRYFATGGVDTAMIGACLDCLGVIYQALDYEHFEYDAFTNAVKDVLRENYWAYRQIHHWRSPAVLLTGSGGDEFLMRSPATIALWCAWHDVDLMDVLSRRTGYHKQYFSREKNRNIIQQAWRIKHEIRAQYPTYQDLVRQICNINANDHQHWHLGNTFTWSPYHDLELTKIMLSLDFDSLIDHFVDAAVTRQIINNLSPGSIVPLGSDKNLHARSVLNGN